MELAEVWCRDCDQPATADDAQCDEHRAKRLGMGCNDECERPLSDHDEPHGAGRDPYGRDNLGPEGFME